MDIVLNLLTKWFIILYAYSVYKTRNFKREIDYVQRDIVADAIKINPFISPHQFPPSY